MSFKQNMRKLERIQRFGVTVDLPLFNQKDVPEKKKLPAWIWDGKGISRRAYDAFKSQFAQKEIEYLRAVLELGGEATDNEIVEILGWPPGYVSARRNALKELGVIVSYGKTKLGPSGVRNTVWSINFQKLYLIIEEAE
ncbi:hypothetical protein [Melioribacter sp. OK-6-Me]|uniref:hypothetical protein n=1 Tax=unclassified Melioribacter TaxID=2627329 RepID=UPI003EDAEAD6